MLSSRTHDIFKRFQLKLWLTFVLTFPCSIKKKKRKEKKKLLTTIHILALYVWERILVFLGIFFLYLCSVNKSNVQVHFRDFFKKNVKMLLKMLTNFTVLLVCGNAIFFKSRCSSVNICYFD